MHVGGRFRTGCRLGPLDAPTQDPELIRRARPHHHHFDIELGLHVARDVLQVFLAAGEGKVLAVYEAAQLPLLLVEVSQGRLPCDEPELSDRLGTCSLPILGSITCPVHRLDKLAAHLLISWLIIVMRELNVDLAAGARVQVCAGHNVHDVIILALRRPPEHVLQRFYRRRSRKHLRRVVSFGSPSRQAGTDEYRQPSSRRPT